MQFINNNINILVKNVNRVLEDNESINRVFVRQEDSEGSKTLSYQIKYISLNLEHLTESDIFTMNISIKRETPEDVKKMIEEEGRDEVYANILQFTSYRPKLEIEDYWKMN